MKIATVGRGNIGGGLADKWEQAGHEVMRFGKDGGDVSDADVVLVAVPGGAVPEALGKVQGVEGKTVIDATNLFGVDAPPGFASNAEFIKSRTNGPTVKSFNLNYARLFDSVATQSEKPGNIWSGDEEAREVVEQLIRDAGYQPPLWRTAGERNRAGAVPQDHGRDQQRHRSLLLPLLVARLEHLGDQHGDERGECSCERAELKEHQLEDAIVKAANVGPSLCHLRSEVRDRDTKLSEFVARLLHSRSLARPFQSR
jgi:8-hydroxy-5-deazaflavin:NADPH oxidoreductase